MSQEYITAGLENYPATGSGDSMQKRKRQVKWDTFQAMYDLGKKSQAYWNLFMSSAGSNDI